MVTTTVKHLNSYVFDLTVRDEEGAENALGVTGYHKFYDEADGWQQVAQLQLGDVLRTQDGDVQVVDITRVEGTHRVYNMTVEADHVYYVGDLTTLTHNNGCFDDFVGPAARVDVGKQGKHVLGHNNHIPGRSILTADPNILARQAGTGQSANSILAGLFRCLSGRALGRWRGSATFEGRRIWHGLSARHRHRHIRHEDAAL